jgi:hypothetical protein
MTTSQTDVDKVMAAFGASPIDYRPHQEAAAASRAPVSGAPAVTPATIQRGAISPIPQTRATERIPPGAGGHVHEIFPLLSRAIPTIGDLKVGAIKRVGDEVPEPPAPEPRPAPDRTPPNLAPAATPEETTTRTAGWQWPARPAPERRLAAEEQSSAQWEQQTPAPLRSHADLIRPIGPRAETPAPPPAARSAPAVRVVVSSGVAAGARFGGVRSGAGRGSGAGGPSAERGTARRRAAAAGLSADRLCAAAGLSAAVLSADRLCASAGLSAVLSTPGDATRHATLPVSSGCGGLAPAGLPGALSGAARRVPAGLSARSFGFLSARFFGSLSAALPVWLSAATAADAPARLCARLSVGLRAGGHHSAAAGGGCPVF